MYGQSWVQGWTPFDNFNQEFLSPTKWLQTPACPYWTQELECVREIQFGQLRLAVRNYGDPNSNVGVQNGNSALYFSNPAAIDGFMSTVVIRRTSATACVANMGAFANAQAILAGSFFNNGTYDVWAFLTMGHDPSMDKGFVWANLLLQRQPGGSQDSVDLGGFYVGETVIAELEWDKLNHRFFARLVRTKTGEVFQQFLPYTDSDTAPPSAPQRLLGVSSYPPNCVGVRTWAGTEATFDNVMIKK
jgi:hypothetical protein